MEIVFPLCSVRRESCHIVFEKIQHRRGTTNTEKKPFDFEFRITAVSHYFQIKFRQPQYSAAGSKILRTQQGRHHNASDELSRFFRIVVISNQNKMMDIFRYVKVLHKGHVYSYYKTN